MFHGNGSMFIFAKISAMNPDTVFQVCNTIALIGWLILIIVSPFSPEIDRFLICILIVLFCIVYSWLVFSSLSLADLKSFGSLQGVIGLFQNETVVTAGWIHYLAFDLLTGIWIKKNSMKYGISHWIIVPCLLFTFMLGPVGLLLYLLVRTVQTKRYFAENY